MHLSQIFVFLKWRDVALSAGSRRQDCEPDDAFPGPLFLQGLHVPGYIVLAGVRAALVVPFQDDVFSTRLSKRLASAVRVLNGERGRLVSDPGLRAGAGGKARDHTAEDRKSEEKKKVGGNKCERKKQIRGRQSVGEKICATS